MAKYIDADSLLNNLPDDLPYKASVKRVLMQAPEADIKQQIIKSLEICLLRCKDCMYYDITTFNVGYGWCKCLSKATWDDFYCGCAERID